MKDATGFDQLGFAPTYDVEVDPEFPADGSWSCPAIAFDRDGQVQPEFVSRWGAPRILRVQPVASAEWVGLFPSGGIGGISGVFATPSPGRLCVLVDGEAYLVRVDAPHEGAIVAHRQVTQVVPLLAARLLLLVRFIDIVALGPDGLAWRSPRLAVDDLRVVGADAGGIRCTGDALGERASIVVDPVTGQVASGPRLDGPAWSPPASPARRSRWQRKGDREKVVSRLWEEHAQAAFPARLRGEELSGVDLVMLDADIAGCVVSWRGNRGSLDDTRQQLLRDLLHDLDRVLPLLADDSEVAYYERLRELARLVSDNDA